MLLLIIDCGVYQEYESGIQPLKQYSEFSQGAIVVFHNDFCEGVMAIERLSAQYFFMHENLSLATNDRGANLHKPTLNQLVEMEVFQLDSTTGYFEKHDKIEIIVIARRLTSREVSVSLVFSEKVTVPGRSANDLDHDLDEYLLVGLIDCTSVNYIKMMVAICNPLFQNKPCM